MEDTLELNTTVNPDIHPTWKAALNGQFQSEYFKELKRFLIQEKKEGRKIYPPGKLIFNAFNLCPENEVKVVLLGQDPYHGPGQAHGLCFSVPHGIRIPPSLRNIFKELGSDLGLEIPVAGDLSAWAKQGILLLNATLTVEEKSPGSHQNKGWEIFTDAVIQYLNTEKEHLVFLLWGKFAHAKESMIDRGKHLVLKAAHPAAEVYGSGGYFNCRHFSKTNDYLSREGKIPIDWKL